MLSALLLWGCTPATLDMEPGGRSPSEPDAADAADDSGHDTGAQRLGDTGSDTGPGTQPGLAEWTLLVFVNGDNDLEQYALDDMNEMEQVGSSDRVNIVVQMDRSPEGTRADGNWSGARRYRVEADDDTRAVSSPVPAELGEVDSGSTTTFIDFIDWGVENWPAQRYAVVFWDHGDGWSATGEPAETKAISHDYSANTTLSVADGDVAEIVAHAAEVMGQRVDLVGMDACTMQLWEVATTIAPYGGAYVASQDYEDVAGWAYDDFLADLAADPTMAAPALGEAIAFRFHEIPDSTLSVVDLEAIPELSEALDEVAEAVIASGYAPQILATAAEGAQGYDGRNSRDHDLLDLLSRMEASLDDPALSAAVERASAAAEALVLSNYNRGGSVKNSHGLSIFSPADGRVPQIYANAPWSASSKWDDMLREAGGR